MDSVQLTRNNGTEGGGGIEGETEVSGVEEVRYSQDRSSRSGR